MKDNKHCRCKSKPCSCRKSDHDKEFCNCNSKPCSCPNNHQPPQSLTTGPFRVPIRTFSFNSINFLMIGLKNHTEKTKSVRVTLDRCPQVFFPNPPSTEQTTFTGKITLDPDQCIQIELFSGIDFSANDLIRVTFTGDIDKEAIAIEATVVGVDAALIQEPTMFFRHSDLVKTCPKFL